MKRLKRALLMPWAGGGRSYTQKVLGTATANLIAYWPLGETSGGTADNAEGTAARDGAYSNVTLGATGIGDGNTAATFNGTTSFVDIFSASIQSAFNNQEGTAAMWVQVTAAGVWTDGSFRRVLGLRVSGSNEVFIHKSSTNNQMQVGYVAGGTTKSVAFAVGPTLTWHHIAITWSKSVDQVIVYLDGAQTGTTQTGLGVWVGSIANGLTNIGCRNNVVPDQLWSGTSAHTAIWTTPLSAAQILTLATVS